MTTKPGISTASATLPSLTRPAGAPKIVSRDLRIAFAVYQELAARNQPDLFPPGLAPAAVHAQLQAHLDEELAHGAATKDQASAVKKRDQLEKKARELRLQVSDLLDASFPPSSPERGDFYPPNQADQPLSQFVLALASGIGRHGLVGLPQGLTAASIQALGTELAEAESARAKAGQQKTSSSTARSNLEPQTAAIAVRLSAMVRGYYGRSSKELAAYGLNVQTSPEGRRAPRKAKKADAPPPA